jgi:hypothetical protein
MMPFLRFSAVFAAVACFVPAAAAHATKPELDDDTCAQLRVEQTKFLKTGILSDMNKGPEWAKSNLSPERIGEIKHYIQLDEQVRFGCRDAKLTSDAEKASAAAARIEVNSDADPLKPAVKDPAKPGSKPEAKKTPHRQKHVSHKKPKKSAPKPGNLDPSKTNSIARPPAAAKSASAEVPADSGSGGAATETEPRLPAFGFGKTVVVPQGSP